jgi:SAM-dependent methyltransferase
MVLDHLHKPIEQCRVLDLACLEGDFGAEFACRGAEVLGIEGRESNIAKARQRFHYPRLTFVQDDVRHVTRGTHGTFDVVLCLGILYHLDAPDCFRLLESIREVCAGIAVIDTHVAVRPQVTVTHRGRQYDGWYFTEYDRVPTSEEQEASGWSSMGNVRSFWPTKPSLINAVVDAGFTSVYECHYPAANDLPADRVSLVALSHAVVRLQAVSCEESIYGERLDESPRMPAVSAPLPGGSASLSARLARTLSRLRFVKSRTT